MAVELSLPIGRSSDEPFNLNPREPLSEAAGGTRHVERQ
jgi:hypothetical protein